MDWFVGKPIDPQTLMATVIEALNAANMPVEDEEDGGEEAQVA